MVCRNDGLERALRMRLLPLPRWRAHRIRTAVGRDGLPLHAAGTRNLQPGRAREGRHGRSLGERRERRRRRAAAHRLRRRESPAHRPRSGRDMDGQRRRGQRGRAIRVLRLSGRKTSRAVRPGRSRKRRAELHPETARHVHRRRARERLKREGEARGRAGCRGGECAGCGAASTDERIREHRGRARGRGDRLDRDRLGRGGTDRLLLLPLQGWGARELYARGNKFRLPPDARGAGGLRRLRAREQRAREREPHERGGDRRTPCGRPADGRLLRPRQGGSGGVDHLDGAGGGRGRRGRLFLRAVPRLGADGPVRNRRVSGVFVRAGGGRHLLRRRLREGRCALRERAFGRCARRVRGAYRRFRDRGSADRRGRHAHHLDGARFGRRPSPIYVFRVFPEQGRLCVPRHGPKYIHLHPDRMLRNVAVSAEGARGRRRADGELPKRRDPRRGGGQAARRRPRLRSDDRVSGREDHVDGGGRRRHIGRRSAGRARVSAVLGRGRERAHRPNRVGA
ncbi:MAG: hypothetical protein BWY81_00066 [Firmicutes bacterium ADurb.Bin467]|nr:MAG: hypothetical protein BWY81_00066 [Firmicutes bacterium ADurb.Bin467]